MSKIVVEVRVPSIDKIYDAKIPRDIQIWEATKLLSNMVASTHPGLYDKDNKAVLCDYTTGQMLLWNKLVDESGLTNGSRVLLI